MPTRTAANSIILFLVIQVALAGAFTSSRGCDVSLWSAAARVRINRIASANEDGDDINSDFPSRDDDVKGVSPNSLLGDLSSMSTADAITTLSRLSVDAERRATVAFYLSDKVTAFDTLDKAKSFAQEFQSELNKLGETAQILAAEALQQKRRDQTETGEEEQEQTKTDEELHLWALVDIMVQSKLILKRSIDGLSPGGS